MVNFTIWNFYHNIFLGHNSHCTPYSNGF